MTSPPRSRRFPPFIRDWLISLLWLSLVFNASNDAFSSNNTSRFIGPALHWLFPSVSPVTLMEVHALIRKAAHVTEYAILAALFWRALPPNPPLAAANSRGWNWGPAVAALVAAAFCAAIDEWHQTFVPSRTGSARDVAIDVAGAALALLLLRFAFFLRRGAPVPVAATEIG